MAANEEPGTIERWIVDEVLSPRIREIASGIVANGNDAEIEFLRRSLQRAVLIAHSRILDARVAHIPYESDHPLETTEDIEAEAVRICREVERERNVPAGP